MTNLVTALIVDDEQRLAIGLQLMIERYCPQIKIIGLANSADEALIKINQLHPQLVFLDISMPKKNAFDMLAECGNINFEIIFVTAYSDYSIQAFKFSAVDYLLKPVDEEELEKAAGRAVKRIQERSSLENIHTLLHNLKMPLTPAEQKICIASLHGFEVIKIADILYCEAESAYTNFILANNKKICASKPLLDFEQLLEDNLFYRIHKSFLINMSHLKSYTKGEGGSVTMSNGAELEVSRRKKEQFIVRLKELYK